MERTTRKGWEERNDTGGLCKKNCDGLDAMETPRVARARERETIKGRKERGGKENAAELVCREGEKNEREWREGRRRESVRRDDRRFTRIETAP